MLVESGARITRIHFVVIVQSFVIWAGEKYRKQFTLRIDLFGVVLRKDKSHFVHLPAS